MAQRKGYALSADTCRDIVFAELRAAGPIATTEMYRMLQKVFTNVDYRVFCSALMKRNCGLVITEGVIDFVDRRVRAPLSRSEQQRKDQFQSRRR
jgi:hypothetical protein